jgi:hypothetical protein
MEKFKDLTINDRIVGSLEITKYDFEIINGDPKIVISMVKVLDDSGKYITFDKMKSVIDYISYYPVSFKRKPKEIIIPENTNFNNIVFYSLEITKYDFEMVNGEPKIVISMINVFEYNGKYIKPANLELVIDYLGNYDVSFKAKE